MGDKFNSITEESISVLRSILWQDDSLNLVKAIGGRLKELEENLKFRIKFCDCETGILCKHSCECWYENEYFEYIDTVDALKIDVYQLDRICNRVKKGRCEHVDNWKENQDCNTKSRQNCPDKDLGTCSVKFPFTFISYVHAAAAVGNLPVVKYLCKQGSDYSTLRTSCGLLALHTAVCKQQSETVKFLKTRYNVSERGPKRLFCRQKQKLLFDCNLNFFESPKRKDEILKPVSVVRRSKLTGKLEKIELGLYSLQSPLASILAFIEHPKEKLLLEVCDLLEPKQLEDIILHLLVNLEEDCAICVYRAISKHRLCHALQVHVACVLTDSDRFLLEMHHAGEDCLYLKMKYCLADLANVVGSHRCLDLMQDKIIPQSPGLIWKYSSNPLYFHVLIQYGIRTSMYVGIDIYLGYLDKMKLQGRDINKHDNDGMVPLHMLLNKTIDFVVHESVRVSFVQKLLELGACVNHVNKQGRTPIFHWIMESLLKYGTGRRQIIKLLLYHNSSPDRNINLKYYAHLIDKKVHRVTQTMKVLDRSSENYQTKDCLNFTFSHSLFATLHELGFVMHKSLASEVNCEIRQMWPVFYREVYTQPRSLKLCCRLIIRKCHPCNKLIKMIENNLIPTAVKQFILAEDLLGIMQDM